jgi:DNA-binding response OmpR family regulator
MRTNGKRILIVENDQALALALRDAFREDGAVVLGPAPTVFYARHLLGRRAIDCAVVSDQLHAGERDLFCQQIIATGASVLTLAQQSSQPGHRTACLVHPFNANQVVDSVIELLQRTNRDDQRIEISPERLADALAHSDNPHMRVMRVRTEAMRRHVDRQKPESQ